MQFTKSEMFLSGKNIVICNLFVGNDGHYHMQFTVRTLDGGVGS